MIGIIFSFLAKIAMKAINMKMAHDNPSLEVSTVVLIHIIWFA
jgi:hypothetical protein